MIQLDYIKLNKVCDLGRVTVRELESSSKKHSLIIVVAIFNLAKVLILQMTLGSIHNFL